VLVLDNFEQITHAARAVSSWCGAAPELCVLVTSRERLAIAGEEVIELGPLGCPNESAGATDVLESEAVRLFSARARAAGGDVGDDTRALARLVRRLDGIPLAIELAAARTRVMRPKDLAARFEEKRDLLGALTSAIDWSWDLLSEREQSALASCSVFAGSFGAAAAEKVVGGDDAVELVAALRDKSLLFATEGGRLALYVSIREYAEKKLAAMGADEPRLAHLRHARAYAEAVRPFNEARTFQGAAPDAELRVELTRDKENLLAALAFMEREAERKGGNLDAEEARVRSELAVGVALLQAAPAEACIDALSGALDREIDTPLRVRILLARQSLWNSLARFQECRADLKALIEIPDTPRGVRILGLVMQGTQLRYQGLPRDAWQSHEEAARELATLDLPRMLAMNTACMGRLKIDFYEPAAARELNERARAIAASVGDRWMAGLPLANLAQLEQEEGNYEKAAARLDDAMQRFRESSEPHYVGVYASALGDLYFEWGKPDVARRWYDEAASFFGRFAAHRQTAVLHAAASALEATYGDVTDALAHLELAKKSASRGESPIVRLVVEAHGASLELRVARDSKDPKALEATLERWRARVRAIDEGKAPDTEHATKSIDGRFATRILRRSLAHFSTSTSTSTSTATSTATATPTSTSTSTSTPTPTAILRNAPDYARF
jgi:tetratricopeptide (TPR) repeat protein